MSRLGTAAALVLAVAACGDAGAPSTPPPTAATPATTIAEPTTTALPPPSTTSSLAPPTTVSPPPAPLPAPTLADGRPASFMAVTDDLRAVEVDTVTGAVVGEHGQMSTPEEVAAAGEERAFEIVVDAVWRTADGEYVVISECCEPAGGMVHYLAEGQVLTPETHDDSVNSDGWTVAPSPFSGDVAVLGYFLRVGPPTGLPITREVDQRGAFPTGMPAWDRRGDRVYWLADVGGGASPTFLNVADPSVEGPDDWETIELGWVGTQEGLEGLAVQASGNLVAFRHDVGEGGTTGVVFTPAGELVASFPVEDDSRFGGYDRTGQFLIYVDGDGTARWQGLGRSGALGDGFVHASW